MNIDFLKSNKSLKKIVHRLLIAKNEARPRLWVSWFVNPFFHTHKRGAIIRRRVRLDVVPFNHFEIGKASVIEDFSTINNGVGDVVIGDNTLIGLGNVIIGPVQIGSNIILAQNVVISGLNHQYQDVVLPIRCQGITTRKIIIEDDCWIGANSVITAGVIIGKHSVIAAGSVVTKNIPSYCVAAGNPAKVIKQHNFETNEWSSAIPLKPFTL
ncbi:acyltransferase [Segetibacter sp.]|jgi:acetyltransferase-like isoleucine patch superfamily enzyme|uniref:acyltransferase n=1 Tax=Segetibacter sp. TaxID=2231182 RepID=UPI002607C9BB|nr:acyltransferase [Segetibacter sp.]MCW3081236.1 acyltransferase [Segetibacter sp.]